MRPKKRRLVVGLILLGLAAAGLGAFFWDRDQEWTTSSPEARAEFEAALAAKMKLYDDATIHHLEQALVHDPDFVIAQVYLADCLEGWDPDRRAKLLSAIAAADQEQLSAREQFLVQQILAEQEGRFGQIAELADAYLKEYPSDPHVLDLVATHAWDNGDFEACEALDRRLLEVSPNWVLAHNRLGYLAMSAGRFDVAEEYFISYRFVAPDQANPHDSLGELYTLLGRYDEAVAELEEAVRVRPDFWQSYGLLVVVYTMQGESEAAVKVAERVAAVDGCPSALPEGLRTLTRFWSLTMDRAWLEVLSLARLSQRATGWFDFAVLFSHRAACMEGDWRWAKAFEEPLRRALEAAYTRGGEISPWLLHMEAVRLATEGYLERSARLLGEIDGKEDYLGSRAGLFKLYNRLLLVEVLLAAGKDHRADRLLREIRAINPAITVDFEPNGKALKARLELNKN